MTRRVRTHANPLRRYPIEPPSDWTTLFEDPSRPFALELGSSHGEFLLAHARCMPGVNILGTEIRQPLATALSEAIHAAGFRNAAVVYGNIIGRIGEFTPHRRITSVYILFPDPWPKKKHHKRRVVTAAFLDELSLLMPAEASIHFKSDHPSLYDDTIVVVDRHGDFRIEPAAPLPAASGWEEFCLSTGRPFRSTRFVRR